MLSNEYAAGFLDGEGCINVATNRNNSFIRVLVVNTNREVLEYFQEKWGGDISTNKTHNKKWKVSYTWRVQHKSCLAFLQDVYPFLIVKKQQVEAALLFFSLRPGQGYKWKEENLMLAKEAIKKIKYLNKKGIDDFVAETQ